MNSDDVEAVKGFIASSKDDSYNVKLVNYCVARAYEVWTLVTPTD